MLKLLPVKIHVEAVLSVQLGKHDDHDAIYGGGIRNKSTFYRTVWKKTMAKVLLVVTDR